MADEEYITQDDMLKAIEFLSTQAEYARQEQSPYASGLRWATSVLTVVVGIYIETDSRLTMVLAHQEGVWLEIERLRAALEKARMRLRELDIALGVDGHLAAEVFRHFEREVATALGEEVSDNQG